MLACGDQTLRAENPAQVAGFISEWWPASNRNRGRIEIGISGRIESEFATAQDFPEFRATSLRYSRLGRFRAICFCVSFGAAVHGGLTGRSRITE